VVFLFVGRVGELKSNAGVDAQVCQPSLREPWLAASSLGPSLVHALASQNLCLQVACCSGHSLAHERHGGGWGTHTWQGTQA